MRRCCQTKSCRQPRSFFLHQTICSDILFQIGIQNQPDTFITSGSVWSGEWRIDGLMRQKPWPCDSKDVKRMHAKRCVFTNLREHVKYARTYMPDGEEDQRSTEDKGKHVAKSSESEHNWAKGNEYLQTGTRCSAPKWIQWMEAVTGHAAQTASSSSSKYLQQCVANLCSGLPRSVCHILKWVKVQRRVVVLLDLQRCCKVLLRSRHINRAVMSRLVSLAAMVHWR